MNDDALWQTKQFYARLTGFLYVFSNATAIFAFWVRNQILVGRDPVQTGDNILASEALFRAGLAAELITIVATTALVLGSYVVLRRVDRNLGLLAVLWRVLENAVLASLTFASFVALAVLQSGSAEPQTLQGFAYALIRVHMYGFQVGFLFLGLGSALMSYLWLRSGYIPRLFAGWGIFASLLMAVVSLLLIVKPDLIRVITLGYMAPMGIFEIGLGFWLLFKGLKAPKAIQAASRGAQAAG
jgi:hypothetical protein